MLDIIAIAEKHFIPIIADEIYEHFVFAGAKKDYIPIASLTRSRQHSSHMRSPGTRGAGTISETTY